jgi:hypothetical protein
LAQSAVWRLMVLLPTVASPAASISGEPARIPSMATALSSRRLESPLLSDRFRPLPHVAWARHGDTTVLLDGEEGMYYTLNEVAGRIWELLIAGEPLFEIKRILADEYEASSKELSGDVDAMIQGLVAARMVVRVSQ